MEDEFAGQARGDEAPLAVAEIRAAAAEPQQWPDSASADVEARARIDELTSNVYTDLHALADQDERIIQKLDLLGVQQEKHVEQILAAMAVAEQGVPRREFNQFLNDFNQRVLGQIHGRVDRLGDLVRDVATHLTKVELGDDTMPSQFELGTPGAGPAMAPQGAAMFTGTAEQPAWTFTSAEEVLTHLLWQDRTIQEIKEILDNAHGSFSELQDDLRELWQEHRTVRGRVDRFARRFDTWTVYVNENLRELRAVAGLPPAEGLQDEPVTADN